MFVLQIATLSVIVKETHADLTWPSYKEGGQHGNCNMCNLDITYILPKWSLTMSYIHKEGCKNSAGSSLELGISLVCLESMCLSLLFCLSQGLANKCPYSVTIFICMGQVRSNSNNRALLSCVLLLWLCSNRVQTASEL